MQPIYRFRDWLVCIIGVDSVWACDIKSGKKAVEVLKYNFGCNAYSSISVDDKSGVMIVGDKLNGKIIVLDFIDNESWMPVRCVDLGQNFKPSASVSVEGVHLIASCDLDFNERVYLYDHSTGHIVVAPFNYGVASPLVVGYGFPTVILDGKKMVYYCGVMCILQWLSEGLLVENSYQLAMGSVVGFSEMGGVLCAEQDGDAWSISMVIEKGIKRKISCLESKIKGEVTGIYLDGFNRVWVRDGNGEIHSYKVK